MRPIIPTLLLSLALLASCDSGKSSQAPAAVNRNINTIGKAAARIDVRSDIITAQAKQLDESPPKSTIIEQAGAIKVDSTEAQAELDKAQVNMELMAGTINNQDVRIQVQQAKLDLLDKGIVGPRGKRWFGYIVGGFCLLGVASVALGVIWPFGWGMFVSRVLNSINPLGLLFMIIRDRILKSVLGITVAAVPTPIAIAATGR